MTVLVTVLVPSVHTSVKSYAATPGTLTDSEPVPALLPNHAFEAVQLLDNRPVVFVARPDGKGGATFERRDVDTSASTGGQAQVVGGISPGEVVVVAGAFAVKSEFARAKMAQE